MIKEMRLEDIEIEGGEKNIVAQSGQGKILKVLFNPTEVNSGVRLRIFTKEGEMIMDVTQGGLYYPRSNVSSEKSEVYAFTREDDRIDYYYFSGGLLFNITTSENFEGVAIDELVLIYQDSNPGQRAQQKMMFNLMGILQEIIRQNQQRAL